MPWIGLWSVIVAFRGYAHLLFDFVLLWERLVVVIGLVIMGDLGLLHDASMACPYFKQKCSAGLGKANSFDTETKFDLYITNSIVSSGVYDKRYDFGFKIDFFRFLKNMFLAPLLMV